MTGRLDRLRVRLKSDAQFHEPARHFESVGRYICHCEDQPGLYHSRFNRIGNAMQVCHDNVAKTVALNGCGDALVYHRKAELIVPVFGHFETMFDDSEALVIVGARPLPNDTEQARIAWLVQAWDRERSVEGNLPPFIWETWSG